MPTTTNSGHACSTTTTVPPRPARDAGSGITNGTHTSSMALGGISCVPGVAVNLAMSTGTLDLPAIFGLQAGDIVVLHTLCLQYPATAGTATIPTDFTQIRTDGVQGGGQAQLATYLVPPGVTSLAAVSIATDCGGTFALTDPHHLDFACASRHVIRGAGGLFVTFANGSSITVDMTTTNEAALCTGGTIGGQGLTTYNQLAHNWGTLGSTSTITTNIKSEGTPLHALAPFAYATSQFSGWHDGKLVSNFSPSPSDAADSQGLYAYVLNITRTLYHVDVTMNCCDVADGAMTLLYHDRGDTTVWPTDGIGYVGTVHFQVDEGAQFYATAPNQLDGMGRDLLDVLSYTLNGVTTYDNTLGSFGVTITEDTTLSFAVQCWYYGITPPPPPPPANPGAPGAYMWIID